MARNPIEANPVTRFLLGAVAIAAMFGGGAAGGRLFAAIPFPYAAWVGVLVGAVAAFAAFSVAYSRYHAAVAAETAGGASPSREH